MNIGITLLTIQNHIHNILQFKLNIIQHMKLNDVIHFTSQLHHKCINEHRIYPIRFLHKHKNYIHVSKYNAKLLFITIK